MIKENDDKLGDNVKVIENQIKAKKAILEEVLRTLHNDNDKAHSLKRRMYIKDILNCEVAHQSAQNNVFSADRIDSFRFEGNVIIRFRMTNQLANGNLSVRLSTCSADCSVRWILFENQESVNTFSALRKFGVLCVAVPLSAFFDQDRISLNIYCRLIETESKLLSSTIYSTIRENSNLDAIPEALTTVSIPFSDANEELELKSIEFMDEKKSVRIVQAIFAVYCCLEIQKLLEFSNFRKLFPGFLENDFDTWRLFVGADRFDGVLMFTQTIEENTKNIVIGKTVSMCQKFVKILDSKCCGK